MNGSDDSEESGYPIETNSEEGQVCSNELMNSASRLEDEGYCLSSILFALNSVATVMAFRMMEELGVDAEVSDDEEDFGNE